MEDETLVEGDTSEGTEGAQDEGQQQDEGGDDKRVPLSALQAEREKRQALAAELAEFRQQREAAELDAAKKRGEFEKLYGDASTQLEAANARLAELEAAEAQRVERVAASNTKRIKALPAAMRGLLDGLSADVIAERLASLEQLAGSTSSGTRTRGETRADVSAKDRADAMAQWVGTRRERFPDAEDWVQHFAKLRAKRGA